MTAAFPTSPLIERLITELGWPLLNDQDALTRYTAGLGDHCLFIPGDPAKNLETNDAAVVLPELVQAWQGRFDCAVVGPEIEQSARTGFDVWPTPSLIFFRDGRQIGAIPRVRDWSDYLTRIRLILDETDPAETARPAAE